MQVNSDGSVVLEGHIFLVNSVHSFLVNKTAKSPPSTHKTLSTNSSDILELHTGHMSIKVMTGKLIEQNVDGLL